MLRLRGSVVVPAVDLDRVTAALPLVVAGLRGVRFGDDGVVIDGSGQRREGLRVARGAHPAVGTRYELTVERSVVPEPSDGEFAELGQRLDRRGADKEKVLAAWRDERRAAAEAAGTMVATRTGAMITLLRDDGDGFGIRVALPTKDDLEVELEVHHPDRWVEIDVRASGELQEGWPVGGEFGVDASITRPDPTDPTAASDPPAALVLLDAQVDHERARIQVDGAMRDDGSGAWQIEVAAELWGRGFLRPIVAVGALLAGHRARRDFADALARLPAIVAQIDAAVARSPDPATFAAQVLADALAEVPIRRE